MGNKSPIGHIKAFDYNAYVGIPHQKPSKLEDKIIKGCILGHAFKTRVYPIWLSSSNKIIETININFNKFV